MKKAMGNPKKQYESSWHVNCILYSIERRKVKISVKYEMMYRNSCKYDKGGIYDYRKNKGSWRKIL